VLAGILLSFTACSKNTAVKQISERVPGEKITYSGSDFVTVGDSENMLLLLDPISGNLRWQDKKTQEYLETKLMDSETSASMVRADVIAHYYSGKESNKYDAYSSMDSYEYAVEMETMSYESIENGVRIVYEIGSNKVSYKDFPAYISKERMETLVLQYLDDTQIKTINKQYRLTKSGIYSRNTNKDQPLSGMAAPELYRLFYEVGKYTYEELEADNTENNKLDEMPQKQNISVTMEYYLDGDDLLVRIPTGEITYSVDYPLKALDVLPFFLSSENKDGYLFLPDGSGALIYLDNNKMQEYQYSSRYYNGDVLNGTENYNSGNTTMNLPVYGMKDGNFAVLGIIEKGAEVATLNTYINGYYSGIPYSRASLTFQIREEQTVASFSDSSTPFTLRKVSDDYYSDDIVLRYCFLTGEKADYNGMADAYSNYLLNNNALTKAPEEEKAPFFVKLLGEVDKQKYFLGIPYDGKVPLTTFAQAEDILSDMQRKGIENIKVDYDGIANGGLNQRAVEKVKISGNLGGKDDLNSLITYADSIGADIYPNFKLQTASTAKSLSKAERSFFISGQVAQLYRFDLVQQQVSLDNPYPTYIIHPNYISDYIKKFDHSMKKLEIGNIASDDFYTFLSASYKKNENISITNAMPNYEEALNTLGQDYQLMLSNPIAPAFRETDYITDLPMKNSGMKILDASIPFEQLVLDGYLTYSTEQLNEYSYDIWENFMKALETKSAPKFCFMYEDTKVLEDTTMNHIFMAQYSKWEDKISEYYEMYNEFYDKVKDATIIKHEIVDRNNDTIMVTYSNGVVAYFNYGDTDTVIQSVPVAANNYIVQ
jgi:hypothetical protein